MRTIDRDVISRIGMSHNAAGRIVPQYSFDSFVSFGRAVANDHETGVLRVAHTDTAAMMKRHPGRAACRTEQRIEQRPVRNGVTAIFHAFGFAIRTRDRAAVQMVAADNDRRFQLTIADHFVESEPESVTLSQSDLTNSGRQPLKLNALARGIQPIMKMFVVGNQLLDLRIGLVDVLGVAG